MTALRVKWRHIIFLVTWLAYASSYLLRKPLGVIKADLESELGLSKTQLGWLDTSLLLPYAAIQLFLGSFGDRFGARKVLSSCLIISSISMVTFGMWSSYPVFAFLLFCNGAAQSQIWPSCIKGLGEWFSGQQLNTILGTWGTCVFAGGVMGTSLAVYLQSMYGWRSTFLLPSFIVIFLGILVSLLLKKPNKSHIEVDTVNISESTSTQQQLTFWQIWKVPMLAEISITMFCVKIVRYCMYMWLPMYLHQFLGYGKSEAGMLSTTFEIGGVAGSIVLGYTVDRWFAGKTILGVMVAIILSAIGFILFLLTSDYGWMFQVTCLLLCGMCNCGPDAILSGTLPLEIAMGRNIQSSLSGFINGFGTIGTILQGPIIGVIVQYYNWMVVFYFMILTSLIGALSMFRASLVKKQSNLKIESRDDLLI
uniref:Sugar phosphate exchanger 2-like n=1 Tax=Saccoglossus kowalevskii TaxID=10224 RepID=A0ABM0MYN4_SACKO|nr:PREDICTED: sugar phosphate exchanger 2-like [Saccoglossus kowalevskii]